MKLKLLFILRTLSTYAFAQTKIEKRIPVSSGQTLHLDFEWPNLKKIQTCDQKDILIKGDVSINKGENDDAFELVVSQSGKVIDVSSILKDKENIPQRIVIKEGDTEYYFKAKDANDPEVQKFLEERGRSYNYMSHGIIKEITLEIFVPKGMETEVESKFGLVEIKNFQAPLKVNSKVGGVDASIAERSTGELIARTEFGEILTNLDAKFDTDKNFDSHDRWTIISAKPGSGPRYDLESKFGKVYLRKADRD
jgi:hypothetical protein